MVLYFGVVGLHCQCFGKSFKGQINGSVSGSKYREGGENGNKAGDKGTSGANIPAVSQIYQRFVRHTQCDCPKSLSRTRSLFPLRSFRPKRPKATTRSESICKLWSGTNRLSCRVPMELAALLRTVLSAGARKSKETSIEPQWLTLRAWVRRAIS